MLTFFGREFEDLGDSLVVGVFPFQVVLFELEPVGPEAGAGYGGELLYEPTGWCLVRAVGPEPGGVVEALEARALSLATDLVGMAGRARLRGYWTGRSRDSYVRYQEDYPEGEQALLLDEPPSPRVGEPKGFRVGVRSVYDRLDDDEA